jgi:hypothetical protein
MGSDRLSRTPRVTPPWRGARAAAKRDMSLIRELLLEIEAGGGARDLDGWDDRAIRAHLRLLIEAGLLHGRVDASGGIVFDALTWAGHDFLAAVRQEAVWNRVRARLAEAGGGIAFDAIKQLALSFLP